MAPGRKRGAKGVKAKSELSLGDLVLARVKGFPFWPARIARPEDWKKAPDPKKFFVHFYGTDEIAFVAPSDIQVFTNESKIKLSARCQVKTVKYFAEAVKEICEEFDLLQCKNISSIRNDDSAQNIASQERSVDPALDEASEVSAGDGIDVEGSNRKMEISELYEHDSGFGHSLGKRKLEFEDVKPCTSDGINPSSPAYVSPRKRTKLSENPSSPVKELVMGSVNEEGSHNVKAEGDCSDGGQGDLTNGPRSKPAMGPKWKHEDTEFRNSGSVISPDHKVDGKQKKYTSGGKMKVSSADSSRLALDLVNGRKEKFFLKSKKHSMAVNIRVNAEVTEENNKDISRKKMKFQPEHGKINSQTMEASHHAKKSKPADVLGGARILRAQTAKKNPIRPFDLVGKKHSTELKRLTPRGKAESHRSFGAHTSNDESGHSISEDDPPSRKPHSRAEEMVYTSASISENINEKSTSCRKGTVNLNKVLQSSGAQQPTKRRAVRLCDDEDDELPKTPVHGGISHNKVSAVPTPTTESKKKAATHGEGYTNERLVLRNSAIIDDALKELRPSSRLSNKTSSSSVEHVSPNQRCLESEKLPVMETKLVLASPPLDAVRPLVEPQKKYFNSKTTVNISQKKFPSGANRGLNTASPPNQRCLKSEKLPVMETKSVLASLPLDAVRPLVKPQKNYFNCRTTVNISQKKIPCLNTASPPNQRCLESEKLPVMESATSMKHLIAAAQARKKQANFHNSYTNHFPLVIPDSSMFEESPTLTPARQAVEANTTQCLDVQIMHPNPHSSDVRQYSTGNEYENDEFEEGRVSTGHQATGSSLSGDTEAAVARDAFEEMIETLSRTKESIGRATRLAIDCAKYGVANEVLDLLIRKLENESSFHRRVDLFFLVDSITQCSHSQKGIAEASYIPIVQSALPRLIKAAAPSGTDAHENRRQCHKVLRLWLERKILPEQVLRRHIDSIGLVNDEKSIVIPQRRLSRAERSIDDPIRDMEGMLVDEYGSNATIQLLGLLPSNFFEDEYNFLKGDKEVPETSPSNHNTPSDRRHCILEDVDGELEMEDVSLHQKEGQFSGNGTAEVDPNFNENFELDLNMSESPLPSPEVSPPFPPGSPPATPPLPSSPPPPPPPPPSSLSPPPPPPPPDLFPPLSCLQANQHAHMISNTHVGYTNNQPFLPGTAPYPEPVTQQVAGHFSYPNSAQQNLYPTYPFPSFPDGLRRNPADEQWQMQVFK